MKIIQAALITALALGAFAPTVAWAECDKAERLRLEEEMRKLAARNAWAGVERAYTNLEKLPDCELPFDDYFLGGQSARYLGKTYEMYNRLSKAKELDAGDQADSLKEIETNLAGIDSNYGHVEIKGNERRPPALTRAAMPFAPDQRKSIEWAQTVIENTGKFKGLLPVGDYEVGGEAFSVAAGQQFDAEGALIDVRKVKGESTPGKGLIVYQGPIALGGPNFFSSAEPKEAVFFSNADAQNVHQFEPDTVGFAGGVGVNLGYELGFTKELGVAGTVGYGGAYGTDSFHNLQGWLAGTVRPGDARIAIGPTYNFLQGKGTGVAEWFDVEHDQQQFPNSDIRYQGFAWGGGLQMSAGYGLVDLNKLQGVVELGGAWQSDGSRSYLSFGLRVGVVPLIERFKG